MTCSGKGVGISAIGEALGLDRKTIRRHAHAPTPKDVPAGSNQRENRVQPHLGYLHQRWNEGCTDAVRLCGEIRALGYRGSERTVGRHLQTLHASGQPAPTASRELTVRQATRRVTSHPNHLDQASPSGSRTYWPAARNWTRSRTAYTPSPR
ncbi:hypothetical protein [Streptacidiphilus sp. PAMC 29251]